MHIFNFVNKISSVLLLRIQINFKRLIFQEVLTENFENIDTEIHTPSNYFIIYILIKKFKINIIIIIFLVLPGPSVLLPKGPAFTKDILSKQIVQKEAERYNYKPIYKYFQSPP